MGFRTRYEIEFEKQALMEILNKGEPGQGKEGPENRTAGSA